MNRRLFFAVILLFLFLGGCDTADKQAVPSPSSSPSSRLPQRIISTVPSITEIMFELDLGDRLIGVSQFCNYPEDVKKLPRIGGLIDMNFEEIIRLDPDLVILTNNSIERCQKFDLLGIKYLVLDHTSISGMLESFETIDRTCRGPESKMGLDKRRSFEQKLRDLQERNKGRARPRVLISIDRIHNGQGVSDVYIAGRNPFFNTIVEAAGGDNVAKNLVGAVPIVSTEGIRELQPEIIIDLATDGSWLHMTDEEKQRTIELYRNDWLKLGSDIPAVRNGRIYPFLADYATIPGPRILLFIEQLADIFHSTDHP